MASQGKESSTPRPKKRKEKEKPSKMKKEKKKNKNQEDVTPGLERRGPVILSPFDELVNVWTLPSRKKQREIIGELFEIPDGAGLCRDSILLDMAYLNLLFAHQAGFNLEQTKVFWTMIQTMQTQLMDPHTTMEKSMEYLKRQLLENSVYHTHFVEPESARNSPSRMQSMMEDGKEQDKDEAPAEEVPSSGRRTGASRSSKRGNTRQKKGRDTNMTNPSSLSAMSTAAADEEEEPEKTLSPARLFTKENIKQVLEHVSDGLLTHYRLYRCVLNPKVFQPRKEVETHSFRLETIIFEDLKLDDAKNTSNEDMESVIASRAASRAMTADERNIQNEDLNSTRDVSSRSIAPAAEQGEGYSLGSFPLNQDTSNSDPVVVLVDRHTTQARADMAKMLEDNQRRLDAKLQEALGDPPQATGNKTKKTR